jgi:hypothetical protein
MTDDDHSRHPWRQWWRRDNCGTCGGGGRGDFYSDTTTAAPCGNDGYTSWPLYLDPWTGTFRYGSVPGGVNVQRPLPSVMLASALPYGLPLQQVGPTFVPPLAHLPPAAWTPWTTPSALSYGLPP